MPFYLVPRQLRSGYFHLAASQRHPQYRSLLRQEEWATKFYPIAAGNGQKRAMFKISRDILSYSYRNSFQVRISQSPLRGSHVDMQSIAYLPVPLCSMFEEIQSELRQVPGNSTCCDCGAPEPQWASVTLASLVCIRCAGLHRALGVKKSRIRSLQVCPPMDVRNESDMFSFPSLIYHLRTH